MESPHFSLVPIKMVNGSTFLSTAGQLFALNYEHDKSLSSYRYIDEYKESILRRVYRRCLPEYNPDLQSYSPAEFQTAIRLGIISYYAVPVFDLHELRSLGLLEIVSTQPSSPVY